MVERLHRTRPKHKWIVFGIVLLLTAVGRGLRPEDAAGCDARSLRPAGDRLHRVDGPQPRPGGGPDHVPDRLAHSGAPSVATVRGHTMFGMSFTYVMFEEGTDIYWARTRVLE